MRNRLLVTAGIITIMLFGSALGGYFWHVSHADASRNSAGTYSLATSPVVSGQTIGSALWNNTFNDLATGVTDSLDRNGRGGMLAALRGIDGTVAAPALSFTSETGSGLYRIGTSDAGFAISGAKVGEWTANGYRGANGAVATPSLSFFNDTGSGLYRIGSNDIGFAINGAIVQEWTATGSAFTGTLSAAVSGTGSTFLATFFEASLANGNSGTLAVGKANSANASVGLQFNPNATAANSTGCLVVNGQTATLCVDGNNKTIVGGAMTVAGTTTSNGFFCNNYSSDTDRCGIATLDGSGNKTETMAAGVHACVCTDTTVVAAAAVGCNVSGGTLTLKGTAAHLINYFCF